MRLIIEGYDAGTASIIRKHFDKAINGTITDFKIWAAAATINANLTYEGDRMILTKKEV